MVDFYTQRIPEHWYYSNFFPERHFDTSEEAIEFEKMITFPHFPRMVSFYERIPNTEVAPWTFKSSGNYQNAIETPGFKQIPYTYKTRKVFIEIEEDKISYYYFNEDTMQYELLETIQDDDDYIYSIFYSNPGITIEESMNFGPDNDSSDVSDYWIEVKDTVGGIEPLTSESTEMILDNFYYYAKAEKKFFWKGSSVEGENELPSNVGEYVKSIIINGDDIYCYDYDELKTSYKRGIKLPTHQQGEDYYFLETKDKTLNPSKTWDPGLYHWEDSEWTSISGKKINIVEDDSFLSDSESDQGAYYYFNNALYSYSSENVWTPIKDGAQILFIKQTSTTEGYLNLNLENSKDKWYVRICRAVYSVFTGIWRGLVKIGKAIGSFFKNLWNWLKGQRYYGTEITFYWGDNIIEIPSYEDLSSQSTIISRDQVFQSMDTPKKFWYFNNDKYEWTKFNCEKYEGFKRTEHESHILSRKKDLDNHKGAGNIYYVIQTQKIYLCQDGISWKEIPIISDTAMRLFIENPDKDIYQSYIFYCAKEKQCYKFFINQWIEDTEHSSLDGLYEHADALRQVLDYKDHLIASTAIKEFNSQISSLNELLGYNFPTNTNTLQPIKNDEKKQGDWGFYYYDKVRGWITGREAYELEIL